MYACHAFYVFHVENNVGTHVERGKKDWHKCRPAGRVRCRFADGYFVDVLKRGGDMATVVCLGLSRDMWSEERRGGGDGGFCCCDEAASGSVGGKKYRRMMKKEIQ